MCVRGVNKAVECCASAQYCAQLLSLVVMPVYSLYKRRYALSFVLQCFAGPPPEQHIRIKVPTKTKLYVDQTQREKDNAVSMHHAFRRDHFVLQVLVGQSASPLPHLWVCARACVCVCLCVCVCVCTSMSHDAGDTTNFLLTLCFPVAPDVQCIVYMLFAYT